MTARQRRNLFYGILFISPWIVGFLAFQLYPIVQTLIWSFTRYQVFNPPVLIGLDNYWQLFHDPLFLKALKNTFLFVGTSVPLGTIAAIAVAMLLNTKVKGMAFYRTVYYLPCVVPGIASTLLWGWILDPQVGLLNGTLEAFHLPAQGWLSDPALVKPSLVIMGLWGIGGTIIIYLSGLQDVPKSLMESAELDGASWWQRLWHITVPMVSPITLFNLLTGVIGTFQFFTQAYVFSRFATVGKSEISLGAPMNSTLFYSVRLYDRFSSLYYGYSSAMAWVLFFIILGCTLLLIKVTEKVTYYAG